MRAWIETSLRRQCQLARIASPAACGRGLKHDLAVEGIGNQRVARRVRAWIETSADATRGLLPVRSPAACGRGLKRCDDGPAPRVRRESPAACGRGLKHRCTRASYRRCVSVARRVRAWIETVMAADRSLAPVPVARRVRAWIETISRSRDVQSGAQVARRVRAWIETL